ncbi:hypothetical protein D3C86_2052650 [compost metagenome]
MNYWPATQHKPLIRQPLDQFRARIGQSLKLIVDFVDAVAPVAGSVGLLFGCSCQNERAFSECLSIFQSRPLPCPVGAGDDGGIVIRCQHIFI